MKNTILLSLLVGGLPLHAATLLSSWTFETNTPADLSNSATGPSVTSESGLFTTGYSLVGVHASALTDWTTPAGYQSTNSYSSADWAVGDYYQFASSSSGYEGVTISLAQVSSNTGPAQFTLRYSTDGSNFTDFSAYTVLANAGNNSWSNGTTIANTAYSFDLSSVSALNDKATVYFRLVVTGLADAAPPGNFAVGGTSRIDNISVSATSAVPEPTSAAVLGSLALLSMLRRRR
jgi:hypothetical protein